MIHRSALALLLVSCQGAEVPRQNADEKPVPAAPVPKPIPSVKGTWQVIALNGRPPDPADYPFIVTVTDREISASSQCVMWFWTYRLSGAALLTQPVRLSEPVCERSLTATEKLSDRIITRARQLRHLTDGGLYITNRSETMVLRRSGDSRSAPLTQ